MHILFVCIHNSGRSQMAEAFANRLGDGMVSAESAGTMPGDSINPDVIYVMKEIGYDLKGHHPKQMTPEMVSRADKIITMGCGVNLEDSKQACPIHLVDSEDWGLEDPKGREIGDVREIRDQIKDRVIQLIQDLK